ncbi:hypothetical protein AALP_AA6G046300 [Arabis alpina]|uniref:Uncharacterized protein n=1 Tax=Arabis alpina TaxID=50452 RepID=A0A087GM38_ARAAL|nr:hypothetical protein AALP_AA6G046300 [Arabis alpina]
MGSLLDPRFEAIDDIKKIQETRNLGRILYGNLGEIKKMTGEAELCVLSPNSNHIFPRVFPHYHQWMSQYGETFLYWNGTTPTIYISDHELGKQILSSKFDFSLRPKKRPEVFILFGKGLPFEGDAIDGS